MNINFIVDDNGKKREVSYDENMKVIDFMKDYVTKYTNFPQVDSNVYNFSIKGKQLMLPRFQVKQLKNILEEGATITFSRKKDMEYSKFK